MPEAASASTAPPTVGGSERFLSRRLIRDRTLAVAVATFGGLVLVAVFGPLVWTHSPLAIDVGSALEPPSDPHPMGTDSVGRDILARFLEGARISLAVGIAVVIAGVVIGATIGIVSGVIGRWVDSIVMRVMDALLAFPALMLTMAVTIGLGAGIKTAAIGIIVASIPWYARLTRSEVLRLRSLPFIEAAVALGSPTRRIIRRNIIPNLLPTLLIQSAAVFGYSILTLAALSFVGLGAQVPTAEWGLMITEGLNYALTGQWWITVFPGLGLLVAVTAVNAIADRLRDMLDPRGSYARL